MVVSVTIATIVGVAAAWAAFTLESSTRIGRIVAGLFFAAMVASIAMPMILHAAAWEATAGKFGWLPLTQTGSRASGLTAFGAFGGLVACGWIHGLFGAAMVTLATWHGTRSVPRVLIEQAELESSPINIWWRIRLPLAMPWLVTSMLATAALAATEMTVVDLYGYRTIADEFYLYFAVNPNVTSIVMTCVVPLVIGTALVAVVSMAWHGRLSIRDREEKRVLPAEPASGRAVAVAGTYAIVVATMILLVPISGLLVKLGHQVQVVDETVQADWSVGQAIHNIAQAPTSFSDEYRWTAIVACLTGVAAVVLAWPLAAWGRERQRIEQCVDFLSIAFFLTPGPIIGLAVVRLFRIDVVGLDALYQRTLIPTMIALLFRAGPLAYWVLRAGYRGLDDTSLDASRLDASRWQRMWCIDRRVLGTSFFLAFAGACVMASGDVPATLPVIPPGVTTVGTRLFGLLHSGARQQEAALAIWYVAAVVVFVGAGLFTAQKRTSI